MCAPIARSLVDRAARLPRRPPLKATTSRRRSCWPRGTPTSAASATCRAGSRETWHSSRSESSPKTSRACARTGVPRNPGLPSSAFRTAACELTMPCYGTEMVRVSYHIFLLLELLTFPQNVLPSPSIFPCFSSSLSFRNSYPGLRSGHSSPLPTTRVRCMPFVFLAEILQDFLPLFHLHRLGISIPGKPHPV